MKQQPREQKQTDKKVQSNWAVQPALSANGNMPMIAVRLGPNFETFISNGMAIALADALVDAMENNTSTINNTIRNRK